MTIIFMPLSRVYSLTLLCSFVVVVFAAMCVAVVAGVASGFMSACAVQAERLNAAAMVINAAANWWMGDAKTGFAAVMLMRFILLFSLLFLGGHRIG